LPCQKKTDATRGMIFAQAASFSSTSRLPIVRASLKDGAVIKTTISFGKDQFPL
jgi:hypothetical protein